MLLAADRNELCVDLIYCRQVVRTLDSVRLAVDAPGIWVLIHSPLVGPMTWSRVAEALRVAGDRVVIPTLVDSTASPRPYWQQHAAAAALDLASIPTERRLILVGHSGAGPLLPAIGQALPHRVASYVFVDAGLPRADTSRLDLLALESSEAAEQVRRTLAAGERVPTWTDAELAAILPDQQVRRAVLRELRPRGLSFYQEPLPVFDRWPDAPCAYMRFSSVYIDAMQQARAAGWPVLELSGGHFHMLVNPQEVAQGLRSLIEHMERQGS